MFILPYFTINPISHTLTRIISKFFKPKAQTINPTVDFANQRAILSLVLAILALSHIFIIIITSQLSSSMINQWIINFILVQMQDLMFTPFITMIITFLWIQLLRGKNIEKQAMLKKSLYSIIDQNIYEINYNKPKKRLFSRAPQRKVKRFNKT